MTDVTKDLIKFIAEMIILLLVFSVLLNPEGGFFSSVFNYMSYAEPSLLQRHIAAAIEVATDVEGEFISEIVTSGNAYIVEVYEKEGRVFISVIPNDDNLNTKFYDLEPTSTITDCFVPETRILYEEDVRSRIYVVKKIINNICEIHVSPDPDVIEQY